MGQLLKEMFGPLPDGVRRIAEDRLRAQGHLAEHEPLEAAFQGMPGCPLGAGMGCGTGCAMGCQPNLQRMMAMAATEKAQASVVLAMHRRMGGA